MGRQLARALQRRHGQRRPGFELKFHRKPSWKPRFLRVGFNEDGAWRTFKVRKDFVGRAQMQTEDDITASVVAARRRSPTSHPATAGRRVKFVANCEYRLFQRPDDAIHRGYDKQTELDFDARPTTSSPTTSR
jgi:hypothetical protein